ncbi:MAG: hypothetical protein ACXWPM_01590 [Bdellovibrionota bacterium]
MKSAQILMLGLFALPPPATAADISKITCDYNSRDTLTELQMSFEPKVPVLLEEQMIKDAAGNILQKTSVAQLGLQSVCGTVMDFRKACKTSETMHNGNYLFSFDCSVNGVTGSLALEGGVAQLSCRVSGQPEKLRTYPGCSVEAR